MSYKLEDCSLYKQTKILGKDIYIFDSHNMALPVWGTYSNRLGTACSLVTFDSHTDTHSPFTAEIVSSSIDHEVSMDHIVVKKILKGRHYKKDDFNFEDVFKLAVDRLKNDEHILAAVEFDYLDSYTIVCREDDKTTTEYQREDRLRGYAATYYTSGEQYTVDFSDIKQPIILDFDLDYFVCKGNFNKKFEKCITPLVNNAIVITIARERDFFETCKIEDDYKNEQAVEELLKMIKRILKRDKYSKFAKRAKDFLMIIDKKLRFIYDKITSVFVGKMVVKLVSEIILALLIAVFTYIGTLFYHESTAIAEANGKLDQIYISVSNEYVNSLFGTPYISFEEKGDLTNNYYVVDDMILRTVSENNNVVAFFVTSTNEKRKIPVNTYETEVRKIGSVVYTDLDFGGEIREANASSNGRYNYYYELQGTGRYGMFNHYLYGTVSYGFIDDANVDLISKLVYDQDVSQEEIDYLRQKAKPNTFGVIADGYEETISIIPFCDEWENMYYLLEHITYQIE